MEFARKRKYSEDLTNETEVTSSKKRYVEVDDNRMIYSVGNEIHFTAPVNDETIESVIKQMSQVIERITKKFCAEDEKITITYIIDSGGGDVYSVLKFVDFIRMAKIKHPELEFVSVITGHAASAGTIMGIVADKRKITKYGYAMIHELSGGVSGKYTNMISNMIQCTELHETLVNIYMDKIGNVTTRNNVEELMNKETWFSAEKYMALGFVDEIL